MLYGMDDYEEQYVEYGLIESKKLNIKKVIIFAVIMLICFLLIFGSFYISYRSLNNKNLAQSTKQEYDEKGENSKTENFKEDVYQNNTVSTFQNPIYYNGNHMQISMHNTEKIMKKFVPQANPNGHQLIKDIYYSQEKQVYLTFDDGPSKTITPQILDILKQHDVKATFFVLGARVDLYPDILQRVYDEGHYIANHGYSHEYKKIYQSKDTVFQEYIECENSIKRALNNDDYNSYLFRFPGGSNGGRYSKIKAEARNHLQNYGIAYTNWNCLNGDAEGKETKEDCIAEFIYTKENQNGLIVLMHDASDKQQTVDALPEIIQNLKNEGYVFKNFYEIF